MSFPNLRLYLVVEGSNPPETESLGFYRKIKSPVVTWQPITDYSQISSVSHVD